MKPQYGRLFARKDRMSMNLMKKTEKIPNYL